MSQMCDFGVPEAAPCGLEVEALATRDTAEAWAWLPATGQGWVSTVDQVVVFPDCAHTGRLLEAEVVSGRTTTVVRHDAGQWRGWRLTETDGDSHRRVRETFVSTERRPGFETADYITYYKRDQDGVWQPVASRFVGFGG